jgi:chemotaxis family two-component system response regulator Rcp1
MSTPTPPPEPPPSPTPPPPDSFHILLVDDSPSDALLIGRALREGGVPHRLTTLVDGHAALAYLAQLAEPETPATHEPDLILLDLNLPGLDGCSVLASIKGDPMLRPIPVVILTTSNRDEDILATYRAGANTFIRKPDEYPKYRDLVAVLRLYWQETALRPSRRAPR